MSVSNNEASPVDQPLQFDPLKPSNPISYPIKTLKELKSRAYFQSFHCPFNKSCVPLDKSAVFLAKDRPKLLVCHDMQGGYGDDKWIQGGSNPNAYAIWHWHLIDIFVYFSHSLVNLPPPCWTNVAHKHGTKVLGTFLTEWDEGRLVCDELLETEESARMYAERLAELATELGFDGWLINMEIKLNLEQIPNLKEFVSHLTKIMNSNLPGSLVIWYDAVTIDGKLEWQDQLNDKNKPFFDICNGIFINYTWKREYPKLSASVAGDRKFDIYMGIDVFGRNTYGGGQWNTNVALEVIRNDNVSAAIFAPGWVYETEQPPDFWTAQNRWWTLVEQTWGIRKNYPTTVPFYSNFDQGQGYHISVEGEQVTEVPWNNLSCQGLQPFLEFKENPTPGSIQVLVDLKESSYNGGANITFKGTLQDQNDFAARLFQGNLLLGELPLYITYAVKSDEDSQLGISLSFSSNLNDRKSVLIAPSGISQFSNKFNTVIKPLRVNNPEMAPGWVIHESSIEMNGHTLTEIDALCYKPKPKHEKLTSEYTSAPSSSEYFAVLGNITLKNSKEISAFPPPSSWQVEGQNIEWDSASKTVSVKISWTLKDGSKFESSKYNIYVEKLAKTVSRNSNGLIEGTREYIGVAYVDAFYVSDLSVPSGTSSLKFIIQVCGIDGTFQKLDDSPYYQLDVQASHEVAIPISPNDEMITLKASWTCENHGRIIINHKKNKASGVWGKLLQIVDYDTHQERPKSVYLVIDLIQKFGKNQKRIIASRVKKRDSRWLLVMFLVALSMILCVFNHNVCPIALY